MRVIAVFFLSACQSSPIVAYVSPPGYDDDVARLKKYVVDPVNDEMGCVILSVSIDSEKSNIEWRTFDELLSFGLLGEFDQSGGKLILPAYSKQKELSTTNAGDCVFDDALQIYDCSDPNANWVYLHEAGHALTLTHVGKPSAVMYGGSGWPNSEKFVGRKALSEYVDQLKSAGIACSK